MGHSETFTPAGKAATAGAATAGAATAGKEFRVGVAAKPLEETVGRST